MEKNLEGTPESKSVYVVAQVLGQLLLAKNLKLTLAESCTGGAIAAAVTAVAGSSAWFEYGLVTYSNKAKQSLLKVSSQTLREYGAVSQQTVKEMAQGAKQLAGANVAISVSGIAGPAGGSPEKPVGTVWFGFNLDDDSSYERLCTFDGERQQIQQAAVMYALNTLIELLHDK